MGGGYSSIAATGSKTTNQGHKLLMHIRERFTLTCVFLVHLIQFTNDVLFFSVVFFFQISYNKLGVLISNAPGKTAYSLSQENMKTKISANRVFENSQFQL